jgi:hypothetical protein
MVRRTKVLALASLGIFKHDGHFRESKSTHDSGNALHCLGSVKLKLQFHWVDGREEIGNI